RTARARTFVAFAWPVVVASCHFVEHPGAHFASIWHHLSRPKQIVNDGCETESGAGALPSLIENRNADFEIARERPLGWNFDQRRFEHAVSEVERIRPGVEVACCNFRCSTFGLRRFALCHGAVLSTSRNRLAHASRSSPCNG